jgi:hypothetical protein
MLDYHWFLSLLMEKYLQFIFFVHLAPKKKDFCDQIIKIEFNLV